MQQSAQFTDSRYADKLELVYREYERSLDLDIAMTVVPLSAEEKERLTNDPLLQARVALCDAQAKGELITTLRGLIAGAASEGVRLAALKELGKTLYPKRFKDNALPGSNDLPPIVLCER